jgi:galactose-1-phosphate uridylyltransferase
MQYSKYYTVMADGTIKQINPFTDNEVWSVPGRAGKPDTHAIARKPQPLEAGEKNSFCAFCSDRPFDTPPEKSRLLNNPDGSYQRLNHVPPNEMPHLPWLFRRVPNLFEIVTVDYWKKNYGYALSPANLAWKDMYLSNEVGFRHVLDVLRYKLRTSGVPEDRIQNIPETDLITMSDAFFGGGHELIIAAPHFTAQATDASELFSSGDMTAEEHYHYLRFTIDAMKDIFDANRYIRYISVFQNWLPAAGASFDHLHKQLVGIDDWGASIRHQVDMLRQDPNIFNELGANFAGMQNLIFAENEHAIAYTGIGHRHPTIEIFSKSYHTRPYEHSDEEIGAMSDLIHACHAASGSHISSNEEWYYTPIDAAYQMPWHVLIKWRVNTSAGFEGGTSIYINPIAPLDLRDRLVTNLYRLRYDGKISSSIRLAEECEMRPNPLRYNMK